MNCNDTNESATARPKFNNRKSNECGKYGYAQPTLALNTCKLDGAFKNIGSLSLNEHLACGLRRKFLYFTQEWTKAECGIPAKQLPTKSSYCICGHGALKSDCTISNVSFLNIRLNGKQIMHEVKVLNEYDNDEIISLSFLSSKLIILISNRLIAVWEMQYHYLCYRKVFQSNKRLYGIIWTFYRIIGKIVFIRPTNQIALLDIRLFMESTLYLNYLNDCIVTSVNNHKQLLFVVCHNTRHSYIYSLLPSFKLSSKVAIQIPNQFNTYLLSIHPNVGNKTSAILEVVNKTDNNVYIYCVANINRINKAVLLTIVEFQEPFIHKWLQDTNGNYILIQNQFKPFTTATKMYVINGNKNVHWEIKSTQHCVVLDILIENNYIYMLCKISTDKYYTIRQLTID